MAKNDRILLDGIIDDRVTGKIPSEKRDEVLEYLVFEQLLKEFDLSADEIIFGAVDGRGDGGIDGFFVFVNGHLLQDPESFVWPRSNSELKLVIITCKHHDTFKQATLDALIATLTEILDLSIDDGGLRGAYSEELLRMRGNLKYAYRKLSPRLTSFVIDVFYASRGDTSEIGKEVLARGDQISSLISENFGLIEARFDFIGATELVALHRKTPNHTLELPFVEALAKGERYVILVRLSDYYRFVSDDGKLRRYLFESNVRDFMGLNRVNEDIKLTLEGGDSPDFWWLNNGVTILATAAAITGKSIQAADIQIVNGLQTTESIFRHFQDHPNLEDDRCVLVKVLVTSDLATRDSIIRATNNQTNVELASLHATDKIQRDIEDIFLRAGLFYERRKNFYANQGHPTKDLVTPLYAAAAYVAVVHKRPQVAASLRAKFMRSAESYNHVFDGSVPLEIWPKVVQLHKWVDEQLELLRPKSHLTERFLKGWRYLVAFLVLAEYFKSFLFSVSDLIKLDLGVLTSSDVRRVWDDLNALPVPHDRMRGWAVQAHVRAACAHAANAYGVAGLRGLATRGVPLSDLPSGDSAAIAVTDEFAAEVRKHMPAQPWKRGVHKAVIAELRCTKGQYFGAIDRLVADGTFYRQKDGVLFDLDGSVVGFDAERVDPGTLELRDVKSDA
jgi:hypothetical protein